MLDKSQPLQRGMVVPFLVASICSMVARGTGIMLALMGWHSGPGKEMASTL